MKRRWGSAGGCLLLLPSSLLLLVLLAVAAGFDQQAPVAEGLASQARADQLISYPLQALPRQPKSDGKLCKN